MFFFFGGWVGWFIDLKPVYSGIIFIELSDKNQKQNSLIKKKDNSNS